MFLRVIRKIFQRHLMYHLVFPLVVGLVIEYGTDRLAETYHGPFWTGVSLFAPLIGIVLTYLAVMFFVFRSETAIGLHRIGSNKLEDALRDATGFFGIAAIDLREWFEPSPQVYLATILKQKMEKPAFVYNRVLIFSKAAYKDLDSQYLDFYFAKALIEQHKAHGIGLAYLKPEELAEIMGKLDISEGKAIGYYPHWLSDGLLKITPASWRTIWHRKLALSVVEYGKDQRLMPFSKHRINIDVSEIQDNIPGDLRTAAFEKLVTEIRKKVFRGSAIDADHDFSRFY
jgi:hypothetical protein